MQINDGWRKRPAAAVVALDGKSAAILGLLCRFKDYEVGDIAQGNREISGLGGEVAANSVIIGDAQRVHGWEPCQLSSNACRICAIVAFILQRNWFAKALRSYGDGLGAVL